MMWSSTLACRGQPGEKHDRSVVNVHLRPQFGRVVLSRLTREQVSAGLAAISGNGVSPNTARHIFHVLRIALNEAVRSEKVRANVCLRVAPPQGNQPVIAPWDAVEINLFLDSIAGNRYAPMFTLAIASGLRQGELRGLRWDDVDQSAGTLTVARQLLRDGTVGPPKSAAGLRTIGLSDLATYAIRLQRRQQAEQRLRAGTRWSNSDNPIFTTYVGSPIDFRSLWHAFRVASERAGVRRIRFHDLRHACTTLLLTGGGGSRGHLEGARPR
jgi:integrase